MSGAKMSYKKYNKTVKNMPPPIMPSELPHVTMDISGLVEYAESVGKPTNKLSREELHMFIQGDYDEFYEENARKLGIM